MESLEEERKEMQKLFNTKDTKTLKEEEVLSKLQIDTRQILDRYIDR